MTAPPPGRSVIAALIGSGVGPSLTPAMHEREGARLGLRYVYRTVDIDTRRIPASSISDLVHAAAQLGYDGLNITHPCKQLVVPHLDALSPEAAALGSVNTIVFADGRSTGHNTDVTGFAKSFRRGLHDAGAAEVVLVGAGGAGSAVAHALLGGVQVGRLHLADVDRERAAGLVDALSKCYPGRVDLVEQDSLGAVLHDADGLVNATPVGMAAHPGSAVSAEVLHPSLWVADIVYRPLETALLTAAASIGCRVLSGAGMAVFQAVDAFAVITGLEPDPEAMFRHFDELVERERQSTAASTRRP